MAPSNMSPRHVPVNRTASSMSAAHTGTHIQWVPLLVLAIVVILIVGVITMPKTWVIVLYNRVRHGFSRKKKQLASPTVPNPVNPATTYPSAPPRNFALLSMSRSRNDGQSQRREREETFIDVHLQEIRDWKKPELQSVTRHEPIGLEEVGLPLPVLHPDRSRERI